MFPHRSWLVVALAAAAVCLLAAPGAGAVENKPLLSFQEITASRHGHTRGEIEVRTQGNSLEMLLDGQRAFKQLYADIQSATKGDFVHGVMFDESADLVMDPSVTDTTLDKSSRLDHTLIRAIQRGVSVRIMANLNAYLPMNAAVFCHTLNAHAAPGDLPCVPDGRHPAASGSVHNKMWLVQTNGAGGFGEKEVVGYVGGMDPAAGRWDTSKHNQDPRTRVEPVGPVEFYGWHDNLFRVRGPAVRDLARHFWQRWNDGVQPAPTYNVVKFKWEAIPVASNPGTLDIQLVRTLGCKGAVENKLYQDFAPFGEFSFRDAFTKLVASAQEFLYLEDQFVYYPEAVALLHRRLPFIKKLIIVTDDASAWTIEEAHTGIKVKWASNMREYYQRLALDQLYQPIEGHTYKNKIHIYDMVRTGGRHVTKDLIYVHSKNYIADDRYMIVGSAGIERAGFTNDVEVSLVVYEPDNAGPDSFIGRARREMWGEHLGLKPDDPAIRDPIEGVDIFEKQAANPRWRLRTFYPTVVEKAWYIDNIYSFYEPDGTCAPGTLAAATAAHALATGVDVQVRHRHLVAAAAATVLAALAVGAALGFVVGSRRAARPDRAALAALGSGYVPVTTATAAAAPGPGQI